MIVVDASALTTDGAYGHFLMAHECCHHTLGHTRLTSQSFSHLPIHSPSITSGRCSRTWSSMPMARAVRMLKRTKESDAIESARKRMLRVRYDQQTGAYYPTGIERADNIAHAAAKE